MDEDEEVGGGGGATLSAQEAKDLRHVCRLSRPGEGHALNFADDAQYRFLVSRLERSGRSPQTSPELFRSLERTRGAHASRGGPVLTRPGVGPPQTINSITGLETMDQLKFIASGLSSVNGGTHYTDLSLQLFDAETLEPLGPLAESQAFHHGEYVPVRAHGRARQEGEAVLAQLTVVTNDAASGELLAGTTYKATVRALPKTPPMSTEPVRKIGHTDNYVLVCLKRSEGNEADCDYGPFGAITKVVVPVAGSISYRANVVTPFTWENANAQLMIVSRQEGGGKKYFLPGDSMSQNFSVSATDPTTLNWNFGVADFGINNPFASSEYVDLVLHFAVTTADSPNLIDAWVTSTLGATPGLNVEKILPLRFADGCIAEGTLITLADGTSRPVELFEGFEQVLAGAGGDVITVRYTNSGHEDLPMVRLTDGHGRSLLLTQGHPVRVAEGFREAKSLEAGDEILTADGKAEVTAVERVPFGGRVWNLRLGAGEEELRNLTDDQCSFYANGILVGDSRIQSRLRSERRRRPENVLAALPERWHVDYLNSLARA